MCNMLYIYISILYFPFYIFRSRSFIIYKSYSYIMVPEVLGLVFSWLLSPYSSARIVAGFMSWSSSWSTVQVFPPSRTADASSQGYVHGHPWSLLTDVPELLTRRAGVPPTARSPSAVPPVSSSASLLSSSSSQTRSCRAVRPGVVLLSAHTRISPDCELPRYPDRGPAFRPTSPGLCPRFFCNMTIFSK